jgi:hypothetical protein
MAFHRARPGASRLHSHDQLLDGVPKRNCTQSQRFGSNRVFVEEIYKESGGSSYAVRVLFSDPTQHYANQEKGEALLDQLMTSDLDAIGLDIVGVSTSSSLPLLYRRPRASTTTTSRGPLGVQLSLLLVASPSLPLHSSVTKRVGRKLLPIWKRLNRPSPSRLEEVGS